MDGKHAIFNLNKFSNVANITIYFKQTNVKNALMRVMIIKL